jgi:hypothetical protein
MSNFKSGSGNLDFGGSDDEEREDEATEGTPETNVEAGRESPSAGRSPTDSTSATEQSAANRSAVRGANTDAAGSQYPYFVRRNNVGDERDTRLEIHVRDKVVEGEGTFRSELAEHLGASEVSKTDAREFALLVAFQHPGRVAELMREEGFGALD